MAVSTKNILHICEQFNFLKHIGFLSRLTPYFLAYKATFFKYLIFLVVLITQKLFYTVLYTFQKATNMVLPSWIISFWVCKIVYLLWYIKQMPQKHLLTKSLNGKVNRSSKNISLLNIFKNFLYYKKKNN